MTTLVIGDIQGCYVELLELVEKAGMTDSDRIVALGDIVDRGPDPQNVIDYFRTKPNAETIMGNHERKHVESYHGRTQPAKSQVLTKQQVTDYPGIIAWMETLPQYMRLPEADLVHGFFEPGIPLEKQWEKVIVGVMGGQKKIQALPKPWYEMYDGDKPLIVGHHNYTGTSTPFIYKDRVYGLDTSCCHGGALTGLLLPEFRIVQVPAKKNYWT